MTSQHAEATRIAAEFFGALILFLLRSPIDHFKQWINRKGLSQMNSATVLRIIAMLPQAITGVELLHNNADSLTKQQLAIGSAMLASGVYSGIDPAHADQAQAVSQALIPAVNSIVGIYNLIGEFTHKKQPTVPTTVPNTGIVPPNLPPVTAVGPEPAPGGIVAAPAQVAPSSEPQPGPGLHTQFNG